MGSRPFKCRYRPFRNSDEEIEVTWFPAAPGALPLGRVSNITIPFWEQDQFEYSDGLLPLSSVVPTGKPVVRPGTGRGHVCGTDEDFREGGIYAPLDPPVTYGVQGLPTCCGAPALLGGGDGVGGVVGVVWAVAPGLTCPTAAAWPVDAGLYAVTNPPFAGEYWWRWPVVNGVTYRVRRVITSGSTSAPIVVTEGVACPGVSVHNFAGDPADSSADVTATVNGWMWWFLLNSFPNDYGAELSVETL
jgi:hypothetical protein